MLHDIVLGQPRTTLGRHPANDLVLVDRSVSAEHAVFIHDQQTGIVMVEDLDSTNGTRVNGVRMRTRVLQSGDLIDIGTARVRFLLDHHMAGIGDAALPEATGPAAISELWGAEYSHTAPIELGAMPDSVPSPSLVSACLRVVSGNDKDIDLAKVVTTIGKLGVAVAAVIRRQHGYVINKLDGRDEATLNGQPLGTEAQPLRHGDRVALAGIVYEFTGH
ncbi:hypothetical protein GCM10027082_42340 [Comamonas humi]